MNKGTRLFKVNVFYLLFHSKFTCHWSAILNLMRYNGNGEKTRTKEFLAC